MHHDLCGFYSRNAKMAQYTKINLHTTIDHIKRNEEKSHMIISIGVNKASDKSQHPFLIKSLHKLGIEENILNNIKATKENPYLTSYSMVKD